MAISVTPTDSRPSPTDVRIWKVIIDNGVNRQWSRPDPLDASGNVTDFVENPRVELLLAGCIPMTENGNPKLNMFGQPMYQDTGHIASVQFSDPADLGTYLAEVWEPLMTAGYAKIEPMANSLQFRLLW